MAPKVPTLPKSWPSKILYTPQPLVNDAAVRGLICQKAVDLGTGDQNGTLISKPDGPVSHVKVQTITDPKHPAFNQQGLFAAKDLPPDSFILLYCGEIHGPEDARETSDYDLSLDREHAIGIDAAKCGNEARFINDYRGVRDAGPNAEFKDVWMDLGNGMVQKGIGVYVLSRGKGKDAGRLKGVRKGDEILVTYGKGFWMHRSQEAVGSG